MTKSQQRLVDQTPFLRYSREDIAEMHRAISDKLLAKHERALKVQQTAKLRLLLAKLEDDLKMRA